MAGVDFFEIRDARVREKFGVELRTADIYANNVRGPRLEGAVGEAAGGRADVEDVRAAEIEREAFEGTAEFFASAGDETWWLLDDQIEVGREFFTRFVEAIRAAQNAATHNQCLRLSPCRGEAAGDEEFVEAEFRSGGHISETAVGLVTSRSCGRPPLRAALGRGSSSASITARPPFSAAAAASPAANAPTTPLLSADPRVVSSLVRGLRAPVSQRNPRRERAASSPITWSGCSRSSFPRPPLGRSLRAMLREPSSDALRALRSCWASRATFGRASRSASRRCSCVRSLMHHRRDQV